MMDVMEKISLRHDKSDVALFFFWSMFIFVAIPKSSTRGYVASVSSLGQEETHIIYKNSQVIDPAIKMRIAR